MTIAFACPECTKDLKVKDPLAGRKIKCPACGEVVVVPDPDAERPAKVRRRADDDEEVDRPRKKKKKQKDSMGLIIGLGVGGVILLVLIIAGIATYALSQGGDNVPKARPAPVVEQKPPPVPVAVAPNFDKVDIGEKKRATGSIRARADRPERLNELRQISLFYAQYRDTFNKPPPTVDEFTNFIKRDSPGIKQAIDEKYYVLLPKVTAATGIVAYEREPDTNGRHGVAHASGPAEEISTQDLVATVKGQGN